MRERLEQLSVVLDDQLLAMTEEANRVGCATTELRDASGAFTAAPVIVALADVTIALIEWDAAHPPTCTGCVPSEGVARFDCPVHGHG